MNLLLLGVILCIQTSLLYGKSVRTKDIEFNHGSIIERIDDVFIVSSNIVIEVDMHAIFLPEDDVLNLKNDLMRFGISLKEMHERNFHASSEISLAQTLSVAEMLSYDIQNKTAEAEELARDLLMWSVRHNTVERRNPLILAGLNILGSVANLGLGISNRLKINNQNKRIEFLQHKTELALSELRSQLSSINQIMNIVNEHSNNIDQVMEVQHLLATLAYYSSKIDHIRVKISHFIEKSKDYVEAITLATKGVLSPHLMPIKDLTLTLENGREKLGYIPLLDAHKVEFYYSLISVSVENYRIMITIPFDSSDAWQSYKIAPFPTFMTNNSNPVISNLTGHVLISSDKKSFTVIKDLDKLTHCSEAMNNKICTADSFEFYPISTDSCELDIVLNGSLSHTSEGCLGKLYPFYGNKFNYRMNNGSWIRYDKAGFDVVCPDTSTAHAPIFVAADGCTGTSTNYTVRGVNTIIREKAYFANYTWATTIIPSLPLPYNARVAHRLTQLAEMTHASSTYAGGENLRYYILLAVFSVTAILVIAVNIFAWRRLRRKQKDLQGNVLARLDDVPVKLKSFAFRAA